MEAKGITRKIDEMGRLVLPKEMRREIGIAEPSVEIEMHVEGQKIVLRGRKKYCCICGTTDAVQDFEPFEDKGICTDCHQQLGK